MPEDRRHAAIMFTDIVGYTALMGKDEDAAFDMLVRNHSLHETLIEKHNGMLIKEIGDGTLASFTLASNAVRCAMDIQKEAKEQNIPLKIGIHEGEMVFAGADVLGDGVNIASRLQEDAKEGCINISASVYRDIKNKADIHTKFIGEKSFKNVDESIKVYKVHCEEAVKDDIQEGLHKSPQEKRLFYTIAILLVLTLAFVLIWYFYPRSQPIVEAPKLYESIAVLAFDDQSPNGDHEWLGDGVADEILTVLTQAEDLIVTGKTSSFSFKGKDATIKEIGEILNVQTVLVGSVSKIDDQLRITSQLIDVESDAQISSVKYDRDASDIFVIIDEVAQGIVNSLISELSVEKGTSFKATYQPTSEAYEYLLKAEHIAKETSKRRINEDGFFSAKEMYLRAISIDPDYVDAVVGLSDLYDSQAWRINTRVNRLIRDSLLNVAYQMDPYSPSVLYSKGFASNNLDSAFYYIKKGYDLDPYYGSGVPLVNKLLILGLYDMCIPLCYEYLSRDPINPQLRDFLVSSLWNTGQIDNAREQLMKGLELHEDLFWLNMLLFYMKVFVDQDIIEAKRISEKLDPSYDARSLEAKALILAMEGRKEEALKENSDWLVKIKLGMKIETLSSLDQIINSPDYPAKDYYFGYLSLKGHIFFESIREEPQFKQWLKEAKLVYDERMQKYGHLFDD